MILDRDLIVVASSWQAWIGRKVRLIVSCLPGVSFVCLVWFGLVFRSALAHRFHSLSLDQSTVAHRAETAVDKHFLTSCLA